nr:two-component response regulator ARR17-like [Ipomoea batatas]
MVAMAALEQRAEMVSFQRWRRDRDRAAFLPCFWRRFPLAMVHSSSSRLSLHGSRGVGRNGGPCGSSSILPSGNEHRRRSRAASGKWQPSSPVFPTTHGRGKVAAFPNQNSLVLAMATGFLVFSCSGLLEGCERMDQLTSDDLVPKYFKATAMLVDDSSVNCKLIERLLASSSCKVTTTENGQRAREFLGLGVDAPATKSTTGASEVAGAGRVRPGPWFRSPSPGDGDQLLPSPVGMATDLVAVSSGDDDRFGCHLQWRRRPFWSPSPLETATDLVAISTGDGNQLVAVSGRSDQIGRHLQETATSWSPSPGDGNQLVVVYGRSDQTGRDL